MTVSSDSFLPGGESEEIICLNRWLLHNVKGIHHKNKLGVEVVVSFKVFPIFKYAVIHRLCNISTYISNFPGYCGLTCRSQPKESFHWSYVDQRNSP